MANVGGAPAFPRRFGPYVLLRPLARGGMGELYLAAAGERGMEKLCVIKKVLPHLVDDDGARRFRDEAKVVVRLSHGNLVTVFDAGKVDGELYIAMDFVEGKDLVMVWNRCAERRVAFPVDISVYITKELARGLGYAHGFSGLELVHRDVSPGNVLLTYSGEVKLTDFGLATSTLKMEQTAPGVIYGKVSYLSPEQARRDRVDARTDVYASGIILWELLTGQPYLRRGMPTAAAADPMQMLERARKPEPVAPSQLTGRVPADLDRIVMKALAIEPAHRYARAEELRADLAAFLARTSPATDADHLSGFMRQLFSEEIERERQARADLVAGAEALMSGPFAQLAPVPVAAELPPSARARDGFTPPPQGRSAPRSAGMTPPPAAGDITDRGHSTSDASEPATGDDPMLGTTVAGRYFLQRLIGNGGMGRVYEARHVEIGKRFAIKILHRSYRHDAEAIERFRREARAASKAGHTNIVDVTDAGVTRDGSLYFAMELLEGITLEQLIAEHGPLPIERTVLIAAQVCRALQAAHAVDVIHRDLKPANVMLVRAHEEGEEKVKVLDFGISRDLLQDQGAGLTGPNVAVGTPMYMSPEQMAGLPPGPASDIYAVGEMLYEMLTGCAPFEADDMLQLLSLKGQNDALPLKRMRPDVPPRLEQIVLRALSRQPEDRQPSMTALKDDLLGYLEALQKTPTGLGARLAAVLTGGGAEEREAPAAVRREIHTRSTSEIRRRRHKIAMFAVAMAGVGVAVGAGIATGRRLHRIENAALRASEAASRAAEARTVYEPPASAIPVAAPPVAALPMAAPPVAAPPVASPPAAAIPAAATPAAATPAAATPAAAASARTVPAAAESVPAAAKHPAVPAPIAAKAQERPVRVATVTPEQPASAAARTAALPPATPPKAPAAAPAAPVKVAGAAAPAAVKAPAMLAAPLPKTPAAATQTPTVATPAPAKPTAAELLARAQSAFARGEYPESIRRGREAIGAGAGADAHVLLGDVYFNMERFRDALAEYENALRVDPRNVLARRGRDLARSRIE